MNQALTISHSVALRWGNAALIGALVGSLGIVGLVAWNAPNLTIFLPVAFLALVSGAFLFTRPRLNFIVWLGGLALLFSSEPGFQIHEVLYGLYFYAYLVHWYVRRLLLYRRPIIQGPVDIAVALWLVMGLGLGVALGLFFGAELSGIRGEAISLTMLALYFPVKEFCVRDEKGAVILLLIIAWIGLYVSVGNFLEARQTFAAATALWEIADVRTVGRELLLTFSGVLLLSVLPTLKNWKVQVLLAILLAILLGGLILTKSRAFWVEYLFAVFVLIVITTGRDRRRLIAWSASGIVLILTFGIVLLPTYFDLLVTGASNRFATMGAASADLSLLNRFVETKTVLNQIAKNPILGYGLGTTYTFYDIIAHGTLTKSYSHIGLIAVPYKFGLWGCIIVGSAWVLSMYNIIRSSLYKTASVFDKAILKGIFACLISMVLPGITSNIFFEDDRIAAFMLFAALGIGIHYNMKKKHA